MKNTLKISLFLILSLIGGKGFSQTKSSLLWATYFGGDTTTQGNGVATDDSGNVYMTGYTYSAGLATSGAYKTLCDSVNGDAFLAKFSSSGSLIWCTYYGGFYYDYGVSVAIDKSGNVYMTGGTYSASGIATVGAYQTSGDVVNGDVFLAKFTSSGSLIWATYYGGNGDDESEGIATDKSENVYISGYTYSTSGIATKGAYQTSGDSVNADVYLAKFNSSGSLLWATYYGSYDYNDGVATDTLENVYITGWTYSPSGIATSGAYQTSYRKGGDAFLTKFNPSGSLLWATYFGGKIGGSTLGTDISGNIYITGNTYATTGIATSGAYQTVGDSVNGDVFLAKFNSTGILVWATYYGGGGLVQSGSVAVDKSGNVYIAGETTIKFGLATSGAYQISLGGGYDAFLAKFSSLDSLLGATYYGGYFDEFGGGSLAIDTFRNVYVSGITYSQSNIATAGAYQTSCNSFNGDAFLAKFSFSTLTGIEAINTIMGNINIFPNPSQNIFNVHINTQYKGEEEISLTDVLGHNITKFTLYDKSEFILNASDYGLKNGVYVLSIHSGNNIYTGKLIVE